MRIVLTSVYVDDQERALDFYTNVLGFVKKKDVPLGEHRSLTGVSRDEPELLLELAEDPAVGLLRDALVEDEIPFTSFGVADVRTEFERLKAHACESPSPRVRARPMNRHRRPHPVAGGSSSGRSHTPDTSGGAKPFINMPQPSRDDPTHEG